MAGLEYASGVGKMGTLGAIMTPKVVAGAERITSAEPGRDMSPDRVRSHGMDGIRELLEAIRDRGLAPGHLRAILHIAIGRTITRADGTPVSLGLTWRELAGLLKQLRYDKDLVREIGADPDTLSPRDRERFWYAAIAATRVDSREAVAEADRFAARLEELGYVIGPSPTSAIPPPPPLAHPTPAAKPKPPAAAKDKDDKAKKKKK
jgi:hypothetical protein